MTEISTVQTEVTPLDVEVTASNSAEITTVEDGLDVTITKKEYKIVGDEVYIAKLYDDAPQWMKDLVQLVVDNAVELSNIQLLNNVVERLNQFATSYVPLNTYTQRILDLSNADASMHTLIETINSNFNGGLNEANAQIIWLETTKASKDEVIAQVLTTISAQLATPSSDLGAMVASLQQAIVTGDSANASSIDALMSSLEGEVDARATAVGTLDTRVTATETAITAQATDITALTTEVNNGTNTWAAADSQVTNSLTTKIENDVASVESKWAYNSVVGINGVYKRSGFGLTTNYSGGSGTKVDPYISEFWIDATKLKFTNSAATGRTAPFTIDASGSTPQITFNGKVSFSNVTGAPGGGSNLLYNSAPMVANETKGWSLGWYNTGITPILGAGSDPWRPSGGGAVYATVPGAPAIGTVFGIAQTTKVPVIGGMWYEASAYISSHRCTSYVTIAWYDSNDTYINEVGGSQVTVAAIGALTNWSRSTLFAQAPANAARALFYVRSIVNSTDPYCFVAFAYLGKAVQGQTVHSDWSEGTSAGATRTSELTNDAGYVLPADVANAINTNTTTIDGSKITTGSVSADVLSATAIYGKTIKINDTSATGGIMPNGTSSLGFFNTNRDKNALGAVNNTSGGYAISGVCTNTGSSVGVHGKGNWGVLGEGIGGGFGFYTLSPSYFESAIYPFTGAHLCLCDELPEVGDILSAYDAYNLTVDNSLPYTALSASSNDAKVFGVYNGKVDDLLASAANSSMLGEKTEDGRRIKPEYEEYLRALASEYLYIGVNALGEGGINVCSAGGNISAGDYITTSNIRGKGMKQEDNIMHNYTVAKALESVDWTTEQSTTKMIACTYHCG